MRRKRRFLPTFQFHLSYNSTFRRINLKASVYTNNCTVESIPAYQTGKTLRDDTQHYSFPCMKLHRPLHTKLRDRLLSSCIMKQQRASHTKRRDSLLQHVIAQPGELKKTTVGNFFMFFFH